MYDHWYYILACPFPLVSQKRNYTKKYAPKYQLKQPPHPHTHINTYIGPAHIRVPEWLCVEQAKLAHPIIPKHQRGECEVRGWGLCFIFYFFSIFLVFVLERIRGGKPNAFPHIWTFFRMMCGPLGFPSFFLCFLWITEMEKIVWCMEQLIRSFLSPVFPYGNNVNEDCSMWIFLLYYLLRKSKTQNV